MSLQHDLTTAANFGLPLSPAQQSRSHALAAIGFGYPDGFDFAALPPRVAVQTGVDFAVRILEHHGQQLSVEDIR